MRTSLLALSLSFLPLSMFAQAHPKCPEQPRTLAAMHSCYRPLLVFSPAATDPRFKQQESTLDQAADDMMDRNMLFVPVLAAAKGYQAPLDAPSSVPTQRELAKLRARFHIAPDMFEVVLIDEDGAESLTAHAPVAMNRLNGLIDAMPRRRQEMQHRDSN